MGTTGVTAQDDDLEGELAGMLLARVATLEVNLHETPHELMNLQRVVASPQSLVPSRTKRFRGGLVEPQHEVPGGPDSLS